jgi:two-component system cell cycle response regulator
VPGERHLKILIADDDLVSLRMMQHTLQRGGYEVVCAKNGREAVEALSEERGPRLALIDWMMPELDGLGVCREVRGRQDQRYVYILLLTANQSSEDVVSGLKAGADDYMTKPCQPAELEARLHTGRRILQLEDKLVEAHEAMRFKANHDGLTSLWNRSAVLALLRGELSRSLRDGSPMSLLLCDIDHFKQINDGHGHAVGDEVLREVSTRLMDSVRAHDAVGRYGGEEFLILLSGCDSENLKARAEHVRQRISGAVFPTSAGRLSVSISVGGTTVERWNPRVPMEEFLRQADEALYRAKAEGRDRVVFAEEMVGAVTVGPVVSSELPVLSSQM